MTLKITKFQITFFLWKIVISSCKTNSIEFEKNGITDSSMTCGGGGGTMNNL